MRVLHVIPSLSLAAGGPPMVAVNIARALRDAEVGVSIYSTSAYHADPRNTTVDAPPPGLSDIDVKVFPLGKLQRLAFSGELAATLRSTASQFDVLHIHQLFQHPQYAAYQAARRSKIPYVVSPHGALDPYLRRRGRTRKWVVDRVWQRQMLDHAGAIHYTTDEERNLVEDLSYTAPACVVPNGVDTQAFTCRPDEDDMSSIRSELRLGPGPLVMNHGRLDRKKGLMILVEAMTQVRATHPDVQLVLVGPDSRGHKGELQRRIHELDMGDTIRFAGLRQGTELQSLIHTADVWALPSHSENFGYAVVEAMAAGKPVVTSPHVNIAPDAARADALCMVDNEPGKVADAILALLDDKAARQALGKRGQEYATRFDWSHLGGQYVDLYSRVIEQHTRARRDG